MLASVIIVAYSLHTFNQIQRESRQEQRTKDLLEKPLTAAFLLAHSAEEGGEMDRLQFLIAMLVHANGLDKEKDILPWLEVGDISTYRFSRW